MPLEKAEVWIKWFFKVTFIIKPKLQSLHTFCKEKLYYQYISHQVILWTLYCLLSITKLFILKHQMFNFLLHIVFHPDVNFQPFFFNSLNILLVARFPPHSTNLIIFSQEPGSWVTHHYACTSQSLVCVFKKRREKEIKSMSYFVLGPVPRSASYLQKIQWKQAVSMNIFRAAGSLGVEGGQMLCRNGEATGKNTVEFITKIILAFRVRHFKVLIKSSGALMWIWRHSRMTM